MSNNDEKLDELLCTKREDWIAKHTASTGVAVPINKLVVGAIIIYHARPHLVLLLKRFENEDYYPNHFELPSGKVNHGETIGTALARQISENTGLGWDADPRVIIQRMSMSYCKTIISEEGTGEADYGTAYQLNFLVQVPEEQEIKLNAAKHSAYEWMGLAQVQPSSNDFEITSATKNVVHDAIRWTFGHEDLPIGGQYLEPFKGV